MVYGKSIDSGTHAMKTVSLCMHSQQSFLARCLLGVFYLVNDFVEEYLYRGSETTNEESRRSKKERLVDEDESDRA